MTVTKDITLADAEEFRQLTAEEKLIEAIEHEMGLGFRHFVVRGAELDTILAALKKAGASHD
jgi:hypothetical protein